MASAPFDPVLDVHLPAQVRTRSRDLTVVPGVGFEPRGILLQEEFEQSQQC